MMLTPLLYPVSVSCNLSCKYCFHRQKNQTDRSCRMSFETFAVFLKSFLKSFPEKEEFEIVWHGGEPLMRGLDFYRQAVSFINETLNPSQEVTHCIQTNGTLINDEWADFFRQNNFKVGVSLDGSEATHNKFRQYRKGEGSFANTMRGIRILSKRNVEYGIVTVVSSANINKPEETFNVVKDLNLNKLQISPCIEINKGKAPFSVSPDEFGFFMCRLYDLWIKEDNPELSIGYIEDIVDFFLGEKCNNCILGDHCHNFIVLDWNGDLKPCEDLFNQEIIFGNIKNTSLKEVLKSDNFQNFYSCISKRRDEVCKKCQWFEICKGGCPYQWRNFESGKTILCSANQMIFEYISRSIKDMYS